MTSSSAWRPADVSRGPYLHGSRRVYKPGESLLTDVVNNQEGEEDDRQMCFATTSLDEALWWAYARGLRHGDDMLYVYEVEMNDPHVDVNAHGARPYPGVDYKITSVMSARGRVIKIFHQVAVADYPRAVFG